MVQLSEGAKQTSESVKQPHEAREHLREVTRSSPAGVEKFKLCEAFRRRICIDNSSGRKTKQFLFDYV